LLAPILLRVLGVRAVFSVAGVMLLFASVRVWRVRTSQDGERVQWKRPAVSVRAIGVWLADQPAVTTMIFVGVLAGTANVVLQTMAPRYVQSVLDVDPADAVYVFAPSSLGLGLALFLAPKLMHVIGERRSALLGFSITTAALWLLGFVTRGLSTIVDPVNPFRLLALAGVHLGAPLRTASLLVVPLGFGMALTTMAVQTYINRRVPLSHQGRTFALQSTIKNGASIVPLLVLGAAASVIGVDAVLIVSPLLLIALAIVLVWLSERFSGHAPASRLDVLASFWQEPAPPPAAIAPGS
jgi:hypothetical protein